MFISPPGRFIVTLLKGAKLSTDDVAIQSFSSTESA